MGNRAKTDNRTHHATSEFHDPPDHKLGGWEWLCHPAAALSSREQDKAKKTQPENEKNKDRQKVEIDHKSGSLANDNLGERKSNIWLKKMAGFGVVVLGVFALASMTVSDLVTYAVLHADEEVLVSAMDTNPDALAMALNAMTIGE